MSTDAEENVSGVNERVPNQADVCGHPDSSHPADENSEISGVHQYPLVV